MIPVSAFVTFENEEGFNRALKAHNYNIKLLDSSIRIEQASEPTDIIWENREITFFSKLLRTLFAVIILGVLIALSFYVVISLKKEAKAVTMKY